MTFTLHRRAQAVFLSLFIACTAVQASSDNFLEQVPPFAFIEALDRLIYISPVLLLQL